MEQERVKPVMVIASFVAKADQENAVIAILRGMIEPTRAEPGNQVYDLFRQTNTDKDEVVFHLIEKYENEAALEFHRTTEHYASYRSRIMYLLSQPIKVAVLEAVDSKH